MGIVNNKDVPDKRNYLGQFFTPADTAQFCLDHTSIETGLVIEPSCGDGAFLDRLRADTVIGLEVDPEVINSYNGVKRVVEMNFYDFDRTLNEDVTFVGNPPYRVPAVSVSFDETYGRRNIVHGLAKKYKVSGVREEAVFFILKSVDLILKSGVRGHIYYILPKTIFHTNSKAYRSFFDFLCKHVRLEKVVDLPSDFANVTTDLCWVHFSVGYGSPPGDSAFYGVDEDIITFHNIFKKTYLGSVPCEGVLLSVRGEPREHFRDRLHRLFTADVKTSDQLLELLSYGGEVHLAALKRRNQKKVESVWRNVINIGKMISTGEFLADENYKPIRHRHEDRWYFRHPALKRAKEFVYQLNPNPCRSFYFPGNPAKGCLDYHGFCDFDVNRNCSPSANRTVPVDGVEDNLVDSFKQYWDENAGQPYSKVFDYLSYILTSDWYRMMKAKYQRFYFGVPLAFQEKYYEKRSLLA